MKQWFYGEKRQRFSFRKLSVGLVSATIGSFFFSSLIAGDLSPVKATEISHGQSAQVSYYYVMESELTEAEKSILIRDIPKHVEEISESYYLVYRPKDQKLGYGALPQTGYSGVWESIFAVAGFTFLVLIFARAKNGKRHLSSILLVTGMGSVLLSPTALAVTNIELAAYNQSINLGVGESLPKPLHIAGFEYIGYLKNEDKRGNSLSSSHKNKSLVDYGTNPDTAPVHEVPELVEYGTSPDTAPVHEIPELAEYGTSPDIAPVHEIPELAEYGTNPSTSPVHEAPELVDYGTNPDTAPVYEVPELDEYGTSPAPAPVHKIPELKFSINDIIRIEKIDFSIVELYTDEITEGSRNIVTPGVQGERTIKTRIYSSNGQEIDRQELSNEETLSPVTQVVKVGTAKPTMVPNESPTAESLPEYPLTFTDEIRVDKINFAVREEETDELVQGSRNNVTPGVQGERTIKTRI